MKLSAARPTPNAAGGGRTHVRRRPPHEDPHPGGDVLRPVHGHARQHRRQRRLAEHPAPLRVGRLRPAVDHRRLHAGLRRLHAHRRHPRRPLRAQAPVPHRPDGLHGRLADRGPRAVAERADRRPRHPGPGRRRPAPGDAVDPHPGVPRPEGARPGDRHLGRRVRHGAGRRPHRRRRACRQPRLAERLLPQHPHRHRRLHRRAARRARVAQPRGPAPRPARAGARHRRPRHADLRAHRGQPLRLDVAADPRPVRHGGDRHGAVHLGRAAQLQPDARPQASSATGPSPPRPPSPAS